MTGQAFRVGLRIADLVGVSVAAVVAPLAFTGTTSTPTAFRNLCFICAYLWLNAFPICHTDQFI